MMRPSSPLGIWGVLLLSIACINASVVYNPIKCNNGNSTGACQVNEMYWFSTTAGVMISGDNRAFVTEDEGHTFDPVASRVNDIQAYTHAPFVMILMPTSGTQATYTTDAAKTWKNMSLPVGRQQLETIQLHPYQVGWLLTVGCTQTSHKCTLYVTKNYGQSWSTYFKEGLTYETYGPPAVWGNSTSEPDLIFMLNSKFKFGYSVDYKGFTELFSEVYWFMRTQYYYWIVEGSNGAARLQSSSFRLDSTHKAKSSYQLSSFPGGVSFADQDYTFLDDTTRSEYVALHTVQMGDWGDIYTSEFDGRNFELSLQGVYRYESWYGDVYDFHRVRGLGGIYIANVLQDTSARVPTLQTLITFDNGGNWKLVQPPVNDMYGNAWPCGQFGAKCSLHLQGEAAANIAKVPSIRTHHNAIGLIIANGNVGAQLATRSSQLSTFLSRDGGLTWSQIFERATESEFGNNGGIIVLAPTNLTNSVYYSLNQGTTAFIQSSVTLANLQYVTEISTEPNGTGLNFFIEGNDGAGKNFFSTFSLDDLQVPDCVDSDYEEWQPSNGVGSVACFMGQSITYLRRRSAAQCLNSKSLSAAINSNPCDCSWEDYECAPNYNPTVRNETDGFTCAQAYPLADSSACKPGEKYREPSAYQLVPDTACTVNPSFDLLGPMKTCPSNSHPAEIVAAVVVSIVVVGGIATLIGLYMKNERFRGWVQSLKEGRSSSGRYKGLNDVDDEDEDNTVA